MNIPSLRNSENYFVSKLFLPILSPLFSTILLTSQASGAFANTFQLMLSKYGNVSGFTSYVNNTPLIIPNGSALLEYLIGFGKELVKSYSGGEL